MSKCCKFCGTQLHEQASFCHICAKSQIEKRKPKFPRVKRKKVILPILLGVLVSALLLSGIAVSGGRNTGETPEPVTPSAAQFPHSDVPESDVPESDVPESDVPESDVPESDVPESDVPESDVPESDVPVSDAPVSDAPVSDAPAPAEADVMESDDVPSVLIGSSGELTYSAQDREYCLSLSFTKSDGATPPPAHDLVLEQMSGIGNFVFSQLFVTDQFGADASEEFLVKVRLIEVSAAFSDGTPVHTEGPLINEDDPLALRSSKVYFGDSIGVITVSWTLTMENDDMLTLQHVLTLAETVVEPGEPAFPSYLTQEDVFLRKLSDAQLAALIDADVDTLQAEISTVADAVAYLDQFPHGRDTFYSSLSGDLILDVEFYTQLHRTEATGPDVYTCFTGWCLSDDYPESRYAIASGDSGGFSWIYHALLLPVQDGWYVVSPAGHSVYWNCVYGFDEVMLSSLAELETKLIPYHAGMVDDSNLFLYHLFTIKAGRKTMNFWLNGDYLATDSGAEEVYRRQAE